MKQTKVMEQFDPKSISVILNTESTFKGSPFTVKSKLSGKDYTFKLVKTEFKGGLYINVYVETQYLVFKHLGVFKNGQIIKKGERVVSDSSVAIEWILRNISKNNLEVVDQNVTFTHTGNCIKCGRILTDFESIKSGLGPICRSL